LMRLGDVEIPVACPRCGFKKFLVRFVDGRVAHFKHDPTYLGETGDVTGDEKWCLPVATIVCDSCGWSL